MTWNCTYDTYHCFEAGGTVLTVSDTGLATCSATRAVVDDNSHCTLTDTNYVDIASGSGLGVAMQGNVYIMWIGFGVVFLLLAVQFGMSWLTGR
jgi:hypothetical protein